MKTKILNRHQTSPFVPLPLSSSFNFDSEINQSDVSKVVAAVEHESWMKSARIVICINSYANGITVSVHQNGDIAAGKGAAGFGESGRSISTSENGFHPNEFSLRLRDTRDYRLPTGKYFLYKEDFVEKLERRMSQLHADGLLPSSLFIFGTVNDPFSSFHKKLSMNMRCLDLFEQYKPNLVVQTRSPMVIAALPTLRLLRDKAVVVIPVESKLESSIARYTPGQPKISQRLIAADGLRRQGVRVNLSASPLLPFGSTQGSAWEFAEMLSAHSDYVTFGSLSGGRLHEEAQLKNIPLARKLVADSQYQFLRPQSYVDLYLAAKAICPEKLVLPQAVSEQPAQLSLFAA